MSNAAAIRAGRAYVELYGDNDALKKDLLAGESLLKGFGQRVGQIGEAASESFALGVRAIGTVTAAAFATASSIMAKPSGATSAGDRAMTAAASAMQRSADQLQGAIGKMTPVSSKLETIISSSFGRGTAVLGTIRKFLEAAGAPAKGLLESFEGMATAAPKITWSAALGRLIRGDIKGAIALREAIKQTREAYLSVATKGFGSNIGKGFAGIIKTFAGEGGGWRGIGRDAAGAAGHFTRAFGQAFDWINIRGGYAATSLLGKLFKGGASSSGEAVKSVQKVAGAIGSVGKTGSRALNSVSDGMHSLSMRGAVISGMAGSIVGALSAAAGIDLRSITSRLMNIQSFAESAKGLSQHKGTGIDKADVSNAATLKKSMDNLSGSVQVLWAQVGAAVAPIVTKALNAVARMVQGTASWVQVNRPLIASLFQIAQKVFAVGAAVALVSKGIAITSALLGAIAGGPLGAVAVALGVGVALWAAFTESGQNAVKWLSERFGGLLETFNQTWEGITNAISGGRLELAARIVWTEVKLAFLEAVKAMGGSWTKFQDLWMRSVAILGDAWDGFLAKFQIGWRNAQGYISHFLVDVMGSIEGKTNEQIRDELAVIWGDVERDNKKAQTNADAKIKQRARDLEEALKNLPANDDAAIATLKQELNKLTEQAKQAAAEKGLEDFSNLNLSAPKHIASAGTFNATAARSLGAAGPLDQIANNTKQTNRHLNKIEKLVRPFRPTFGGAVGM